MKRKRNIVGMNRHENDYMNMWSKCK